MKLAVDLIVQRGDQFLLIRRKYPPFAGALALPGGFVEEDETIEAAACRELLEETGILCVPNDLRLIGVFSAVNRDPRERTVSVAYYVTVPEAARARAGDDAGGVYWLAKEAALNQKLSFDHHKILESL